MLHDAGGRTLAHLSESKGGRYFDHLDGMQLAAREMVSPLKLNELDHKP